MVAYCRRGEQDAGLFCSATLPFCDSAVVVRQSSTGANGEACPLLYYAGHLPPHCTSSNQCTQDDAFLLFRSTPVCGFFCYKQVSVILFWITWATAYTGHRAHRFRRAPLQLWLGPSPLRVDKPHEVASSPTKSHQVPRSHIQICLDNFNIFLPNVLREGGGGGGGIL